MKHQRNNAPADLEAALHLHRAGRFQEAEAIYKKMPHNPDALHLRGVLAHQLNRNDEAVELIDKAIGAQPSNAAYYFSLDMAYRALNKLDEIAACYQRLLARVPDNAVAHNRLGNALKDLGQLEEAVACYQKAIMLKPDFAEAYNNMGIILADHGNPDSAIECYQQAIVLDPSYAAAYANLGIVLRKQRKLDEAATCYQQAIALKPDFAAAHTNLGNVLQEQGKLDEGVACLQRATALQPDDASLQINLGNGLIRQDRVDEAMACYLKAVALKPNLPEAHSQLGTALARQGKIAEAVASYLHAIALKPNFPEAFNELGIVFRDQGSLKEAADCCETALALKPDFAEAHNNMGIVLSYQGNSDQAIRYYQQALELKPDFAGAYSNLGLLLHGQGRNEEAIACHRNALAHEPDFATGYSNLLLAMQYSAAYTPEEVFKEHVQFAEQFETSLKPNWTAHPNPRDPNKRLKIGYVSPDFRKHAVAYFIEPILACHDKSQVEVYCYYTHTHHDQATERMKALADHWVPCKHFSDERLAERIRADGIDILVDLAGHTGGTRLLAFARKPAPVQVTYLGYPATTGLTAIDYRLTDVHAEPVGMTEQFSVEQLWRLPEMFCVYRALANSPQVIDHPPSLDNGYVTFGCFNNFAKVTDPVLKLWAKLLDKVPSARLMLEIHGVDKPEFRAEVESRLARLGIPLARLILIPRKPENQYVLYNRIDIALDPFPQNGGTTSMDAVWMGVPLVTLAGRHFSSRMGVTILSNAGLPELIAGSEEDYVNIAAALAQDAERLKAIRAGLRERVKASPLMNEQRFTQHLEQAYRGMWQTWCDRKPTEGTGS